MRVSGLGAKTTLTISRKMGDAYLRMGNGCLAEHLGRYVTLTEQEKTALDRLTVGEHSYRRGNVIRPEHGAPGDILVVQSGWLFSSALLEDGRRQIVRLHFLGDLLGLDALAFAEAPDAICALTDCSVCVIDRAAFGQLFADHPRLGALLYAVQQVDRITLVERLVSLGRSSAKSRVAALLMWVIERLRFAGTPTSEGIALPLTQEEIGDLTGLTAVHVNRTMRALVEDGLLSRSGQMLRILDDDRMMRLANHNHRKTVIDRNWLPGGR
jgi:CRP/FNR family transcriptional regulator, anaerobic regulatory protein